MTMRLTGDIRVKFTPRRVVVAYIIAIVILALLAVTRLYVPKTAEEGEFYIPYLFVSGPVVWFAAIRMTLHVKMALSHHLSQPLGPLFWIVLVPGIFNILLGSLQWYLITLGVLKVRQSQVKEATQ
jgi:hypothetical protein